MSKMMKIKLQLLWIASTLLAGTAYAQSSVTLYGVVGDGLNYTSNVGGHSALQLANGNVENSRWGLLGSEDLGGGNRAIFRLENGFNVNTGALGQGGREFGRQAYVGLASNRYGTLTLGRQYDPTIDLFARFTVGGSYMGALGTHPLDNDNTGLDFRVNNSVKYVSPEYHGVTAEAMYAFSNEPGGFADNRLYGGGLRYSRDGVSLAAAYMKMNNPGGANGAVATDGVFTGSSQQDIVAGASYKFSSTELGLAYSHVDVYSPTSAVYLVPASTQPPNGKWNSWKFDNIEVNGRYFFHPYLWAAAAYTFTYAHLAATTGEYVPKWHQLTLMLNYDLSKMTAVYLQGTYVHLVSAHTGTAFDTPQVPVATTGASSSENQMVLRVGMTKRF
jgi:predicted porin